MSIEIRAFGRKDLRAAAAFAGEGMSLDAYTSNKLENLFYQRATIQHELMRSSVALGAYDGDRLAGFIFAKADTEPTLPTTGWVRFKDRVASWLINRFDHGSTELYYATNEGLLADLRKSANPTVEITFFAVDTEVRGKGVGSLLLAEVERRFAGQTAFLYSDTGAVFQFYLARGFTKAGSRDILLPLGRGKTHPLTCMIFTKLLG
jgi:ribosomal protein S18 acetylase RimI-like enzyme